MIPTFSSLSSAISHDTSEELSEELEFKRNDVADRMLTQSSDIDIDAVDVDVDVAEPLWIRRILGNGFLRHLLHSEPIFIFVLQCQCVSGNIGQKEMKIGDPCTFSA